MEKSISKPQNSQGEGDHHSQSIDNETTRSINSIQ